MRRAAASKRAIHQLRGAEAKAVIMPDSPLAPTFAHLFALAQAKKLFGPHRTITWNDLTQAWNEATDDERARTVAEARKRKRS